jgi:hypothetical protein
MLLSPAQAATRLGIARSTLRLWTRRGIVQAQIIGNQYAYDEASLDAVQRPLMGGGSPIATEHLEEGAVDWWRSLTPGERAVQIQAIWECEDEPPPRTAAEREHRKQASQ